MGSSWIRPMRRAVGLLWLVLLVLVLAFVGLTQLAPHTGNQVYIIRGGSMAPAVPLGSLVIVAPVDQAAVRIGDVLTVTKPEEVVYTHRVVAIVERDGQRHFQLKGDANQTADGGLVPASAIIGRVHVHIPLAGYFLALLAMPSGVMSLMSLLGALLLGYWLLEDLEPYPEPGEAPETVPEPQAA